VDSPLTINCFLDSLLALLVGLPLDQQVPN
jgi:hypothetical protein